MKKIPRRESREGGESREKSGERCSAAASLGRGQGGRQCRCRGGTRLVRLGVTRVRPSPTKSDQKNMNTTRNDKIGRRPKAVREQANHRREKGDFRAPTSSRLWTPLQPTRPLRIQPLPNVVTRKADQRPALRPMSPSTSGGTGRRWNLEIYPGIAGFIRVNPSKSDHRKL